MKLSLWRQLTSSLFRVLKYTQVSLNPRAISLILPVTCITATWGVRTQGKTARVASLPGTCRLPARDRINRRAHVDCAAKLRELSSCQKPLTLDSHSLTEVGCLTLTNSVEKNENAERKSSVRLPASLFRPHLGGRTPEERRERNCIENGTAPPQFLTVWTDCQWWAETQRN